LLCIDRNTCNCRSTHSPSVLPDRGLFLSHPFWFITGNHATIYSSTLQNPQACAVLHARRWKPLASVRRAANRCACAEIYTTPIFCFQSVKWLTSRDERKETLEITYVQHKHKVLFNAGLLESIKWSLKLGYCSWENTQQSMGRAARCWISFNYAFPSILKLPIYEFSLQRITYLYPFSSLQTERRTNICLRIEGPLV
jgi:hypothetical protein